MAAGTEDADAGKPDIPAIRARPGGKRTRAEDSTGEEKREKELSQLREQATIMWRTTP